MHDDQEILFHIPNYEGNREFIMDGVIKKETVDEFLDTQHALSDLSYHISIFKVKDELFVNGTAECELEDLCYRCLQPTAEKVRGVIEATYIYGNENDTNSKEKELESLENVIYYVGSQVDLFDRVIEALIIAKPQRFLCAESCKGLCPFCGEDLNENPNHECDAPDFEEIGNPFSQLKALEKKMDKE